MTSTTWRRALVALAMLASVLIAGVLFRRAKVEAARREADVRVTPELSGPRVVQLDPETVRRLNIRVAEAGAGSEAIAIELQGTLEWDRDHYAEVGARLDGRVTALDARVGDRVRAGEALGRVASPELGAALADYVRSRAAVVAGRANERRQSGLLAQQLTTAREAEVAQEQLHQAEAGVAAARQRLAALGLAPPDRTDSIASDVHVTLVSPIAGTVVARDAVLGGHLSASDPAFVIADTSRLWALIEVYESDLRFVAVGATVNLTVDAYPDRPFEGRVEYIDPRQDEATRATRVRVVVPNPDGLLRRGQFVRARLRVTPSAGATAAGVRVPTEAVQPVGTGDVVFVERGDGRYEVRSVRTLRRGPQVVELAEGLHRGERIVTEGAFLLRGELLKQ